MQSEKYKWDETNSVGPHATAEGTLEFLCEFICKIRGQLAKTIVEEIDPNHDFLGEMLADCFCKKDSFIINHRDGHRTDFRMLEFIQQAVIEKINDKDFVRKFAEENFYLSQDREEPMMKYEPPKDKETS